MCIVGIKVIQQGVGYLGKKAIELMLRKNIEVVAAIGHQSHIGEDIGKLAGLGEVGVKVTNDVQKVLENVKADVVSNCTGTTLLGVYEHIKPFIEAGINVVTMAEEFGYPWYRAPKLSKEIHTNAKANNVTVVGTGLNPGFSWDFIPIAYISACWRVDKIKARRVTDWSKTSPRRALLRFGKKPEEFRKGVVEGKIPLHTGFYECMHLLADSLNWKLDKIVVTWEMAVSKSFREAEFVTVQPGTTVGFKQVATGIVGGEARIVLELCPFVHPNLDEDGVESGETIWIEGEPSFTITTKWAPVEDGTPLCTVARLVNTLQSAIEAESGLLAVTDLPLTKTVRIREVVK
ncbi:MAG TPA: hypothetical protein ENI07_01585 [Desulfobacterales bacterium]|nr:hypothetical protein [Desulfobacterales bacterium]